MTRRIIVSNFFLTIVCQNVKLINNSGLSWTEDDYKQVNVSKRRCIEEYKSCLKLFIKREKDIYWAICGGKLENKKTK